MLPRTQETPPAMRTDGATEGYFGGELRQFALPVFGEMRQLQDKHDLGPAAFEVLFRSQAWRVEHVADVIRFGLIGGGMGEAEADKLVKSTIAAGRLLKYVPLAHQIIIAALGPLDPETEEKKAEAPPPQEAEGRSSSATKDSSPTKT